MPVEIRSPADYRAVPWRNGQGSTTELAREDAATPAGFFWRISRADVVSSGPFSEFPGVDRWLMLLSGLGIVLDFADARETLTEPHGVIHFPGDVPTNCQLIDGPCMDLNVMVARDLGAAAIFRHNINARTTAAARSIFLALDGNWSLTLPDSGYHLPQGSLAIVSDETATPLNATGTGMLVQVDILPR